MKGTKSFPSRGSNISKRVITSSSSNSSTAATPTTTTAATATLQLSQSRRATANHQNNVKPNNQQHSQPKVIPSGKPSNSTSSKDQVCDICAQNIPGPEREKIFAFGKCDHFVCYVCSARLRVICDQLDCPICREKLDIVSILVC